MIDELKSTMLYIERSTKPKLGIPSGLCEIDIDTGKTVMPDSWDIDSTLLEVEDPEDKVKNMNTVSYTSPDMSQLLSLYNSTLKEILNTVGLSPNTLGIEDTSGANASSLALNIREHASLRKRATLILCYTKAFQELAKLILMYNGAIISNDRCIVEDVSNYEYTVDFSEYNNPTFDSIEIYFNQKQWIKIDNEKSKTWEHFSDLLDTYDFHHQFKLYSIEVFDKW